MKAAYTFPISPSAFNPVTGLINGCPGFFKYVEPGRIEMCFQLFSYFQGYIVEDFFKCSKKWIVKYAIYYLLIYHKYLNACIVSSNILESRHIKMKMKKMVLDLTPQRPYGLKDWVGM